MPDSSLYESVDVWNQEIQPGQKNLAQAALDFWPEGVKSVLDVGCGDGKITQKLAADTKAFFCGLDQSKEALSRLVLPGVKGDVSRLPFRSGAFDLVMSTDVFEHLSDSQEGAAWSELFRVAKGWVYVAVPFREELLEATTKCHNCGAKYHVNWHQRPYDIPDMARRVPSGWRLAALVLSGEPWSPMLPPEIAYRRLAMNEWSGWAGAVCPECGAAGLGAENPAVLPQATAKILGQYIYEILSESRYIRSHSEILAIYCRNGVEHDVSPIPLANAETLGAAEWRQTQPIYESLDPYPQVSRMVVGADGGYILQLPVYPRVSRELVLYGSAEDKIRVLVEDGDGLLCEETIEITPHRAAHILMPRDVVPGYYGLLVRISTCESLKGVVLRGLSPIVHHITPADGKTGYSKIEAKEFDIYVQAAKPLWIDADGLFSRNAMGFAHVASVKMASEYQRTLERERNATCERIGELEAQYRSILEKKVLGRRVSKWLGC